MMMKWRNFENFFPFSNFFTRNLKNYRNRFKDKNGTHNDERNERIRHKCDGCKRRPERERTRVAHKNFGRMDIEPQECEQNSTNNETKSR